MEELKNTTTPNEIDESKSEGPANDEWKPMNNKRKKKQSSETEVKEPAGEDLVESSEITADTGVKDDESRSAEETANSDSPAPLMDIEHFSDYRTEVNVADATDELGETSNEAVEETVEETYEALEERSAEEPQKDDAEYREYENLTILDELEEEDESNYGYTESADEVKFNPNKLRKIDYVFDMVEMIALVFVSVIIIFSFLFTHSVVDGDSMMGTLYDGEHLIVSDLFYEPKQYDIIVCEDYSTGLRKPIVKRIIATEGQTVLVNALDEVYVDGELVDTSFVYIDGVEEQIIRYPISCVVPKGEVFVMGDHRNNSLDSRQLGTIDEDAILGKVIFRFFPIDKFGKVD